MQITSLGRNEFVKQMSAGELGAEATGTGQTSDSIVSATDLSRPTDDILGLDSLPSFATLAAHYKSRESINATRAYCEAALQVAAKAYQQRTSATTTNVIEADDETPARTNFTFNTPSPDGRNNLEIVVDDKGNLYSLSYREPYPEGTKTSLIEFHFTNEKPGPHITMAGPGIKYPGGSAFLNIPIDIKELPKLK